MTLIHQTKGTITWTYNSLIVPDMDALNTSIKYFVAISHLSPWSKLVEIPSKEIAILCTSIDPHHLWLGGFHTELNTLRQVQFIQVDELQRGVESYHVCIDSVWNLYFLYKVVMLFKKCLVDIDGLVGRTGYNGVASPVDTGDRAFVVAEVDDADEGSTTTCNDFFWERLFLS